MVELNELQRKVATDRYYMKDASGSPVENDPDQMWRRVAYAVAQAEYKNNPHADTALVDRVTADFYRILKDFRFVPGGRILSGAGTGNAVSYYNCYVIPNPGDSRGDIFDSLKTWAEIQARGGGVGTNLSTLRPRGSYIKSVNGFSSGPISWAELYSVVTGDVIQQGGSRRGAAMLMLDDDHPDIVEFIEAKRIDPRTGSPVMIEHANVSVAVSDEFMQAVKDDAYWQTRFPTNAEARRIFEETGAFPAQVNGLCYKAREIWDLICERAHATAEPGVIFIDRANRESNSYYYLNARATNPCGEILLPPWHVCNLGALNLSAYVVEGRAGDPLNGPRFDFLALERDAATAQRFLDNVIDATPYFIPENERAQKGIRRTGLGTMGLADALIKLGLRYGSDESLEFISEVYATIRDAAYMESVCLAEEKGPAPDFVAEPYLQAPFVSRLPAHIRGEIREHGIRNISLLCVAPTGSTSLLAGVSSGIEPVFSFVTRRVDRIGEHLMYHPLAQAWLEEHPGEELPDYFAASHDLTPEDHVRVQATVQRYIDQQISKTVNAPHDHTVEDVKRLYMLAYDSGCKGVTYYRDGSRDAVLTAVKEDNGQGEEAGQAAISADTQSDPGSGAGRAGEGPREAAVPGVIRPRPAVLPGYTREVATPVGDAHVTINSDKDGPLEVFVSIGRAGTDLTADSEAIGRLISVVLRIPSAMSPLERLELLSEQLVGIGGRMSIGFGKNRVLSLPDGIGQVLRDHVANERDAAEAMEEDEPVYEYRALPLKVAHERERQEVRGKGDEALLDAQAQSRANTCPTCGERSLVYQEGCESCLACGYSRC